MSTVPQIESAIERLSKAEMREVPEWLENFLEDELEFKEDFVARIKSSEDEMAQGKKPRTRQP